ncbi:hypothetical protein [Thalassospira sp. TSL5-1]|uniref:hypothetical protein n=1 Tax=Thalassospira sp. TSL5-1 TaxID=1544451 RepID=UPI00093DAC7E|nr:hypothetical protein [Thalassospira sp. TSL5-1]OKH86783.1 hypothetical protein LF95_20490 [Thalassospira sp. TSL5-1]
MQNPFLDRLQAAAQRSTRPRFASALVLVILAHTKANGKVDASRAELAAAVDRSHAYPARNKARAERLGQKQQELDKFLLTLDKKHANGGLTYGELKQARERAIDAFLKDVRSPTLANVSRVINEFIRAGLISAQYIDAQGNYYDVPAKGRIAEYRLTPPASGSLLKLQDTASQNKSDIWQSLEKHKIRDKQHSAFQLDLL